MKDYLDLVEVKISQLNTRADLISVLQIDFALVAMSPQLQARRAALVTVDRISGHLAASFHLEVRYAFVDACGLVRANRSMSVEVVSSDRQPMRKKNKMPPKNTKAIRLSSQISC